MDLTAGPVVRYAFRSSKALWQSFVHSNAFLRTSKNGKHLLVALETNLLRAATRSISDWTSLTFCGGFISSITWILSEFASILLCDTIKPKNFPDDTPKAPCWDSSSCCTAGVYQMFPLGRPDEFPRPDSST